MNSPSTSSLPEPDAPGGRIPSPPTAPPLPPPPSTSTLPPPTVASAPTLPASPWIASDAAHIEDARSAARNDARQRAAVAFAVEAATLPSHRTRRIHPGWFVIVVVLIVGGIGSFVEFRERAEQSRFPTVSAAFDHRSSEVRFTAVGIDGQREASTARVDLETSQVLLTFRDGTSWRGDRARWYQREEGVWVGYWNDTTDLEDLDYFLLQGGGLTIDQVLPPLARRHVEVVDVDEIFLHGVEVRHFMLVVDEHAIFADDAARAAMSEYWGPMVTDPDVERSNLELWITDEGEVRRIRSDSDLDSQMFDINVIEHSDEPFDAELPTEFIEGN